MLTSLNKVAYFHFSCVVPSNRHFSQIIEVGVQRVDALTFLHNVAKQADPLALLKYNQACLNYYLKFTVSQVVLKKSITLSTFQKFPN